jgi:crossover junction endodeoxyribonuclease RuvC
MRCRVVGIDPSLTGTGVATVLVRTGTPPESTVTGCDHLDPKTMRDLPRIRWILSQLRVWAYNADLAVIEGPSYNSITGSQHERGGLWWAILDRLTSWDVPVAVVPPTSRAKYATGSGGASKDAVLSAAVRRYPDAPIVTNDEADAVVLAAMGARWLGAPLESTLPATHLSAMTLESKSKRKAHTLTGWPVCDRDTKRGAFIARSEVVPA